MSKITKRIHLIKRIILSLLIVLGVFTGATVQRASMDARKLRLALFAISNLHVDSTSETKLVGDAIIGMLDRLNPHSNYMDPEKTKEVTEPLQGNFDGTGIQFNVLTDTLYVTQVIPGGPSEEVGLMAGDRIIQVDDTLIAGVKMKTTDIMKKLRGPEGTEVHMEVKQGKSPELTDFKVVRSKIPVYSLNTAYTADKNIGYIKLNRFAASSADGFRKALKELWKQGIKNLILDLRGNGGGYLNIATELADEFLDKNRLIVYTKRNKQPREETNSTARGQFQEGRLVVLVDESSTSANEIVSGAIQDWDRGVIIGRHTFDKGLIRKPIPLPDDSMIRLTVSRYYTPTGRCIQKPYENGKVKEYHHDLIDRYNRGGLMSADSIHLPDSMRCDTLISRRTRYGGGDIMSDVFIPVDTARYTDYHQKLVASGLINRVSMNHLNRNRNQMMAKYPKSQQYKQDFAVGEDIIEELLKMASDEKIKFEGEQYSHSKSLIMLQIRTLIVRDLYDMTQYFQIINDDNPGYQKAPQIISNEETYGRLLGR